MSRFFSRALIVPAVASFLLLPSRSSAQLGNHKLPQHEATMPSREQDVETLNGDSLLEIFLEKAENQIIDEVQKICKSKSTIDLDELKEIISKAIEEHVLLGKNSEGYHELLHSKLEELYPDHEVQEFPIQDITSGKPMTTLVASNAAVIALHGLLPMQKNILIRSIPKILIRKPFVLGTAMSLAILHITLNLPELSNDNNPDDSSNKKFDSKSTTSKNKILCLNLQLELTPTTAPEPS